MPKLEIRLVAIDRSADAASHPIETEKFLVGRNQHCDLWLDDKSISKTHSVIARHGDQLLVTDLGSRTGTVINGATLALAETAPLQDGDLVRFGTFSFRLSMRDVETGAPVYCEPQYVGQLPYPLIAVADRMMARPTELGGDQVEPDRPGPDADSGAAVESMASNESAVASPGDEDEPSGRPEPKRIDVPDSVTKRTYSSMGSSNAAQDALRKMFPGKQGK